MDWLQDQNGWLAETEHGFFLIYQEFDRWYIDYERGVSRYGDGNGMPLTLHGFRTLDAAKTTAEKYAKSLDVSEVVQSWKFGQVLKPSEGTRKNELAPASLGGPRRSSGRLAHERPVAGSDFGVAARRKKIMVKGKYRDLADIVRISAEAEEGGKNFSHPPSGNR